MSVFDGLGGSLQELCSLPQNFNLSLVNNCSPVGDHANGMAPF
jgi:hypothetical protein